MATEIERKFLVSPDVMSILKDLVGCEIKQGYVVLGGGVGMTVRVRQADQKGFVTLKGVSKGIACKEFECELPLGEVLELLQEHAIGGFIEKTRYKIPADVDVDADTEQSNQSRFWEVDVFKGALTGLVVAEIELESETQQIKLPHWIRNEVSSDLRYKNSNLLGKTYPFKP